MSAPTTVYHPTEARRLVGSAGGVGNPRTEMMGVRSAGPTSPAPSNRTTHIQRSVSRRCQRHDTLVYALTSHTSTRHIRYMVGITRELLPPLPRARPLCCLAQLPPTPRTHLSPPLLLARPSRCTVSLVTPDQTRHACVHGCTVRMIRVGTSLRGRAGNAAQRKRQHLYQPNRRSLLLAAYLGRIVRRLATALPATKV